MTNMPSPAEELRILDHELVRLDARRSQLLARRAWLIGVLQSAAGSPRAHVPGPPQAPTAGPGAPPGAGRARAVASGGAPEPDVTPPGVQNVLLVLGGLLLTVAAIAFTVVSWGHLGIVGRSAVLGAVTLAASGAPVLLLRRGLAATAEAVAGLGLALTVLDAYALHRVALPDVDATGYAAVAAAVLAAVWVAYGYRLDALRLPLPAAVVCAQLPLLLWAIAAGSGPHLVTAALLVPAGADAVVALRVPGRAVRTAATVCACGAGGWGLLAAGWLSSTAGTPSGALRAGALLLLATVIALGAAWRMPRTAPAGVGAGVGVALVGGLTAAAAAGGLLRTVLPGGWAVPGYLACGVALLPLLRTGLPDQVTRGLAAASTGVQGVAVLWASPVAVVALLGPLSRLGHVWSGAPADARDAMAFGLVPDPHPGAAALVLAVVAVVLAVLTRFSGTALTWRPAAGGALVAACGALLVLPLALRLPYAAALVAPLLLTAGNLAPAVRARGPVLSATVLALVLSGSAACLALASETATVVVLAVLALLFTGACALARAEAVAYAGRASAAAAVVYATGLAWAAGASGGLSAPHTALLVVVVTGAAALIAARLGGGHALTPPVEAGGLFAGLVAVALAVEDRAMLALVLALCGVIAAGTAVREDRRRVAGAAATVLFVAATWVRLIVWDVHTPEAYTLPVTVPALLIGVARRRREGTASSWAAYGPGLAATLVPSLFAAWGDAGWERPLLLGTAALAVTLAGARHRLQAPLVLGGGVLALDALHELAPVVVQVMGALPRWLPPALAGLVLLALGATYERRMHDARRMREALGRMR